jgi:hypothetical protein
VDPVGAFFPRADQPAPLSLIMSLDPLTYGVAALRTCLVGTPPWVVPAWRFRSWRSFCSGPQPSSRPTAAARRARVL